ncbi:MAG TPA: galactokinase [Puia sp.]|jgi:galactokinase|nr:galactokinase [Puia sp.]
MESDIRRQFQQYFGKEYQLAAAPGRVNLIGEHTDYNQGYVLPAAIDRNIWLAMAPNDGSRLTVRALEYGENYSFSLDDVHPVKGWPTYLLGMIYMIMPGRRLSLGLDVVITGNVPVGSGMSSSAALCSAFGMALNEFFHLGLSKLDIALAGQKTEQQFANVQCGIMDQFASLHGKAGQLMKLDCRNLECEYIPFDFPEIRIILVNTMVSHSLASTEYNLRRKQCDEGVSILRKYDPAIQSLRDINMDMLESHRRDLDDLIYKRCHFVIGENQRLLNGCDFLKMNNLDAFGQLMYASHEGLSKEFEVSCAESDFLVNKIKEMKGVKGARQMGGGFGGCIITLVEKNSADIFITDIQSAYERKYGKIPDCYSMVISEGAHIVKRKA